MSLRPILLFLVAALGVCAPLSQAQAPAPVPVPPEPLSRVLADMRPSHWEEVVDVTRAATKANILRYPSTKEEQTVFQGDLTATTDQDRLAIFSDDGCTITIREGNGPNDRIVLDRKGQGQPLPDFAQSLHRLPIALRAGEIYHIRVEYSNISYTGAGDIDGASLFSLSGSNPFGAKSRATSSVATSSAVAAYHATDKSAESTKPAESTQSANALIAFGIAPGGSNYRNIRAPLLVDL